MEELSLYIHVIDEPEYSARQEQSVSDKRLVASVAATLVRDSSTIALDCGTTAYELCRFLLERTNLTIVTTSVRIMELCIGHPNLMVVVPGGNLRPKEGSLVGCKTAEFLSEIFVDQFFLGIGAINLNAGITEYSAEDTDIKKILVRNAKEVIGLSDSSKLNKVSFSRVCGISDLDVLVINGKIDEILHGELEKGGVRLLNPR
jgi:DeoR/GlpR family transcriptional regulator of sugar metabolism